MKKSEMVQRIYDSLLQENDAISGNERFFIDYILTKAEELGMLPPQKDDGRDVFLWSYVGDSFEWEPEDEVKEDE